jgi:opacity protein-like surface antigen
MKKTLLLSLLLSAPAFAGTSQVMTESYQAPMSQDDTWRWFVGGTAGYLTEAEEEMYTLQVGANSPWAFGKWSVALYGEAGWTENEDSLAFAPPLPGNDDDDLDIIPLTFNAKFEHIITGGLSAYVGGGLGAAYVTADFDAPFGDSDSADDWVFTAQVFAGLAYHFNDMVELFGGARWIYFEDPDFTGVSLDDDVVAELGLRFHF